MLETEINPNDEKWFSNIEAPQIVANPNLINWNDEESKNIGKINGLFPTPGAFFNLSGII